jgi:hypothetical protein
VEKERQREKGLRRDRSNIGGHRKLAWVDFDCWLKSTPEYFWRRQSNRTINLSKIVNLDLGGLSCVYIGKGYVIMLSLSPATAT